MVGTFYNAVAVGLGAILGVCFGLKNPSWAQEFSFYDAGFIHFRNWHHHVWGHERTLWRFSCANWRWSSWACHGLGPMGYKNALNDSALEPGVR